MTDAVFTFGKFKDYPVDEVPSSYLLWCIDNEVVKDPDLAEAIREEFATRYGLYQTVEITSPLAKSIYYKLCKKYHPDHGGNGEAMKAINEFYDLLKSGTV